LASTKARCEFATPRGEAFISATSRPVRENDQATRVTVMSESDDSTCDLKLRPVTTIRDGVSRLAHALRTR
jgi:hypothetical protein